MFVKAQVNSIVSNDHTQLGEKVGNLPSASQNEHCTMYQGRPQ